jgi:hypothetical protein
MQRTPVDAYELHSGDHKKITRSRADVYWAGPSDDDNDDDSQRGVLDAQKGVLAKETKRPEIMKTVSVIVSGEEMDSRH